MKLYLLLLDDFESSYYFHGVFEDTPKSWETINRIIAHAVGYKIVQGNVIKKYEHLEPDDEADFIDYE